MTRRFSQVDVFSDRPLRGNPVAVVHDADGLTDDQMAAFARWTNLSETTFLLPPTDPAADYRLRIFTTSGELPFAGHPTLGSAHAWLAAGGVPRSEGRLVQECGAGLVSLRQSERIAFAAPPLVRSGPVADADLDRIARALRIGRDDIVDAAWTDNGPGWVSVLLRDADAVLAVEPDLMAFGDLDVGIVGPHPAGSDATVEVRALCPGHGVVEDPVTGSLNAGIAQWLTGNGTLPASYVARQGTAVGRAGRVYVDTDDAGVIWVGGDTRLTVTGTVDVGD